MLFVLDKGDTNLDFYVLFFSVLWKLPDLCKLKDSNADNDETKGSLEFYILMHKAKGMFTWTRDSELPRVNDCPGAGVTSRSYDCLGASSVSSDHYEELIWIPLVFTQIVTENEF